jgi:glycosyltransferase involved in cell wall biosynthesis
MIVKNESRVIQRLLSSVANVVDCYCICDTGSTDNTVEIIQDFFKERGIPGAIIHEPFRDFGYNRTFALHACAYQAETKDADYILLLDADMIFRPPADPAEFKRSLIKDVYYIFQGRPGFYYKNIRVVRNVKYNYWGVTHEYLNFPPGSSEGTLPFDYTHINDVGDGGAKKDKFERDIRLLKRGLEELPDNVRYTFYLANSYKDAGQKENAAATYKRRTELGGWYEEVWNSFYQMGHCCLELGRPMEAIDAWLQAFQVHPKRMENLYEIAKYYRENSKNHLAYEFFLIADRVRKEYGANIEYLFLQKTIYEYKLDYEFTIIGYYVNHEEYDMVETCMNVLRVSPEDYMLKNVLQNYKFYSPKLRDLDRLDDRVRATFKATIHPAPEGFNSSTPTLCAGPVVDGRRTFYLNVRYVNYYIDDKGGYINRDTIDTINHLYQYAVEPSSGAIELVFDSVVEVDPKFNGTYVGIEDVRLLYDASSDVLYYNGNRGLNESVYKAILPGSESSTGTRIAVEYGRVNRSTDQGPKFEGQIIYGDVQNHVEKNWTLAQFAPGDPTVIYGWRPFQTGAVEGQKYVKTAECPTPEFFRFVRGSSNGIPMDDDETWFLCHVVSYEDRRYYYHLFVVVDNATRKLKRYTRMFTFSKEKVEYSLGVVRLGDDFLIGYSVYDKSTDFVQVPISWFQENIAHVVNA